jgi:carboxylesterase
MARIAAIRRQEDRLALNPLCHTQVMTHGRKVAKAIILLHGYTNCPLQFQIFGEGLYRRGYNVLIPRVPHHGLADRLTTETALLSSTELARVVDESVDIAAGLGEHITIAGISSGGVMAAWAAQQRRDVDLAVVMAPMFGLRIVPALFTAPVMNLAARLPNRFMWWDPRYGPNTPGPSCGYPRFSTHGLAEVFRLGSAVRRAARRDAPAARSILVITNAADIAVNNTLTKRLVRTWRRHQIQDLRTYRFPLRLKLMHDFVDPEQANQPIERVYPVLVDLITEDGRAWQDARDRLLEPA